MKKGETLGKKETKLERGVGCVRIVYSISISANTCESQRGKIGSRSQVEVMKTGKRQKVNKVIQITSVFPQIQTSREITERD